MKFTTRFCLALLISAAVGSPLRAQGLSRTQDLQLQSLLLKQESSNGLFPATEKFDLLRLQYVRNPVGFDSMFPRFGPALGTDIALRVAMDYPRYPVNGLLPNTPFINYLRWRRSLNPARFDHYHPQWASALQNDSNLRASLPPAPPSSTLQGPPAGPAPQIITPSPILAGLPPSGGSNGGNGNGNPPPPGGGFPPPSGSGGSGGPPPPAKIVPVPEPTSLTLRALGAVSSLVAFRRRSRNSKPTDNV
ncbi:MAG: hypothetical protein NVSMB14_09950 [Isosphaeraceae bacterium]